jgi:hypothetical protein
LAPPGSTRRGSASKISGQDLFGSLYATHPARVRSGQRRQWRPRYRAKSPVAPLPTQTSRAEVAFAERFAAEAPDLDVIGKDGDVLREVLVHMIEEYARHNGHIDLLRERIDGRVGQ